jgi:hypothetical protein
MVPRHASYLCAGGHYLSSPIFYVLPLLLMGYIETEEPAAHITWCVMFKLAV